MIKSPIEDTTINLHYEKVHIAVHDGVVVVKVLGGDVIEVEIGRLEGGDNLDLTLPLSGGILGTFKSS